ncbi:MAG: hypothetical protein GF330_14580, partial [Candidatus Eisenbacteria bacterium]|nr:hypothetical protein [Candidatus Eisenbacteria bacterium]
MRNRLRMVAFASAAFVALFLPTAARSAILVVSPDGSGEYPTIQAAIDAASHNDTIELTDGTFAGEGNRGLSFPEGIDYLLRSQSGDPAACWLDLQGYELGGQHGFQEVEVEGIGFRNGSGGYD